MNVATDRRCAPCRSGGRIGRSAALIEAERHRQDLSDRVRRAGAGARPSRHGGARRRIRLPGRAVRLRQEHACCGCSPASTAPTPATFTLGRQAASTARRPRSASCSSRRRCCPGSRSGRTSPCRSASAATASASREGAVRELLAHRRAARLREQVSLRAVRRHAAARRHRPRAGARSEAAADGRAVRRARCADPREDERRAAAHLAAPAARPWC